MTVCLVINCPELATRKGRCREHQLMRPSRGPTRRWRAKREQILKRDGYRCTVILEDGTRCPERANLHVDHIVPWSQGGPSTDENLRTACAAHNLAKGDRDA